MHLILYGIPRGKKNSQQIWFNKKTGKRFITQSDNYKQWEKDCLTQIKSKDKKNIAHLVNVGVKIYKSDERRSDLVNYLQAVSDLLVKAGVLKDDYFKIIYGYDNSSVHLCEKGRERIEVEITDLI